MKTKGATQKGGSMQVPNASVQTSKYKGSFVKGGSMEPIEPPTLESRVGRSMG